MEDKAYYEFLKECVSPIKRKFLTTNCRGVKEAYRWIRKNKLLGEPMSDSVYYKIIKRVHKHLAGLIIQGIPVKFPYGMGGINLNVVDLFPIKDGKLVSLPPIDWDRTHKLWYTDNESREKKTFVRRSNKYTCKAYFCKRDIRVVNMLYYRFKLQREIQNTVMKQYALKKIDAFLYTKTYE